MDTPVHRATSFERDPLMALAVFCNPAVLARERHGLRVSLDGEEPLHVDGTVTHRKRGALEGHLGVALDGEEPVRTEVGVAI